MALPLGGEKRRRNAFSTTDTELKLMAAAAVMGFEQDSKRGVQDSRRQWDADGDVDAYPKQVLPHRS